MCLLVRLQYTPYTDTDRLTISQLIWFGSIECSWQCLWVGRPEVVTRASLSGAWTEWAEGACADKTTGEREVPSDERRREEKAAVCTLSMQDSPDQKNSINHLSLFT